MDDEPAGPIVGRARHRTTMIVPAFDEEDEADDDDDAGGVVMEW